MNDITKKILKKLNDNYSSLGVYSEESEIHDFLKVQLNLHKEELNTKIISEIVDEVNLWLSNHFESKNFTISKTYITTICLFNEIDENDNSIY